ncbi:MAG: hypothetical protein HFJ53_00115 [Clostridia bacterium]|nr:hypothetical protein [Clostridia bacterium]
MTLEEQIEFTLFECNLRRDLQQETLDSSLSMLLYKVDSGISTPLKYKIASYELETSSKNKCDVFFTSKPPHYSSINEYISAQPFRADIRSYLNM